MKKYRMLFVLCLAQFAIAVQQDFKHVEFSKKFNLGTIIELHGIVIQNNVGDSLVCEVEYDSTYDIYSGILYVDDCTDTEKQSRTLSGEEAACFYRLLLDSQKETHHE